MENKPKSLLNPDKSFTDEVLKNLRVNVERYGYAACPCRLASGKKSEDADIICPCDYRDQDVAKYDTCFCGLYVSQKAVDENIEVKPIPDRRLTEKK